MLEFSDAPYRFFEARPCAPLIRLGRVLNRWLILPGRNHRIREIRVEGETEALKLARQEGARLMFVINHPSHSDPQVVTEVQRRLGVSSSFMAAYDVFMRSPVCAWCMQRLGHFSIDREGSDRKAMAAAIQMLVAGERALNIFPEGNVYLSNDRVTPFLDGAAFIALKAQAAVGEERIVIVPMSLKFTHLTTPRETITERMLKLGEVSGYVFPPGSTEDPVGAVIGLGRHIIGGYLLEHGYAEDFSGSETDLYRTLEGFVARLVAEVEDGLEIIAPEGESLVLRIQKIRSKIHQIRTDKSGMSHPEIDGLAEKVILALRIHGYITPYLTERPTIDRYDETVERIAEDFHSRAMPRTGPRRAMVMIHAPLDVSEYLKKSGGKLRDAIVPLSADMQHIVQAGIDRLNENNDAPGGKTPV